MSYYQALERIHITLLVYPIACGMILLFLSPIRFGFPSWVVNPFSGEIVDVLASYLTIIICSFCLGFPMYLIRPLITGNGGLNERIRKLICIRAGQRTVKMERLTDFESANFWKWLHSRNLGSYANSLLIQFEAVSAFITGAEIAFILNFFYVLILAVIHAIPTIILLSINLLHPRFVLAFWLMIITLTVSLISMWFNRSHFRDSYAEWWNSLIRAYRADSEIR